VRHFPETLILYILNIHSATPTKLIATNSLTYSSPDLYCRKGYMTMGLLHSEIRISRFRVFGSPHLLTILGGEERRGEERRRGAMEVTRNCGPHVNFNLTPTH
jgi:hypothetical protein